MKVLLIHNLKIKCFFESSNWIVYSISTHRTFNKITKKQPVYYITLVNFHLYVFGVLCVKFSISNLTIIKSSFNILLLKKKANFSKNSYVYNMAS